MNKKTRPAGQASLVFYCCIRDYIFASLKPYRKRGCLLSVILIKNGLAMGIS